MLPAQLAETLPPTSASPTPSEQPSTGDGQAEMPRLNPKIAKLEEKIAELEKELDGRDPDKVVKAHIGRLHKLNETKDVAQALISKYAEMNGTTRRAIHEQYGLPTKESS